MLLSILVNPLGLFNGWNRYSLRYRFGKIEIKPIGVVGMIVSLLFVVL